MFAIVEINGQQFKVEEGQEIFVHQINEEEGKAVTLDQVLLIDHDGKTSIGTPTLGSASVKATVVEHRKGDKVIVFKKKRRKGYKVKNGHRQHFTKLKVDSIVA